jgi:hypothetical protein
MIRRFLLVAITTIGVLVASGSSSDAATPQQVASQAWPNSPCAGHITILFDHTQAIAYGFDGFASGIRVQPDESFILERCEITLDPNAVAGMTPAEQCELVVHEAGHLAGLHHTPEGSGVMGPHGGYWPGCHTLRDRIRHDMGLLVPDTDPFVVCRKWEGRVLPCRVEYTDSRERAHVVWFRARTRGQAYAIQRVRTPR